MNTNTIVSISVIATILSAPLAATAGPQRRVQVPAPVAPPAPPAPRARVPAPAPPSPPSVFVVPAPPAPPDFQTIEWPDLPDLPDVPDFPDLFLDLQLPDLSALPIPPVPPVAPVLPDFFALQDKAFKFQDKAAKPVLRVDNLYEQARNLIEGEQYARALSRLDTLIAQFEGKSVAESTANRVDAAMYWKAYAQTKQRQLADAMTTLQDFQKRFADSRWLKDAKALEVEVRQASGQAVSPDSQTDEDLKLLALRGLMQNDPDRAVPMIEGILSGNSSLKVKENALFVLSQSRSSRTQQILGNVAKGGSNPDLQLKAIRYLGAMRSADNEQILEDAYRSATDEAVKRAIIRSFMTSGNRTRLASIASDTNSSAALRGEAIQQLGAMRANDELSRMYPRETSPELKRRIIQGLFIGNGGAQLVEIAKAEKDLTIKKDIVQKLSLMRNSKEAMDYLVELLK